MPSAQDSLHLSYCVDASGEGPDPIRNVADDCATVKLIRALRLYEEVTLASATIDGLTR